MNNYNFNDQQLSWNQLAGFDHLNYLILNVDRKRLIVDVLFKFSANQKIALHRHVALNHMFVVQGEHRIYSADGRLTETRPTGRYTVSPASDEPHQEGGGDQDVIILFSIRGTSGTMYEILDAQHNIIATLGIDEFENLYAAQAK
ncbi:MAG: hypothetical protein P1U47_06840 [Zhongshania sp.]|uniref:cupin domain-containing protein n=1 Tax=Zhongshania sp. TaxID=1971902 RepID=UPI002638F3E9|nr:hypothetical protein [Zhongshania sp.]MDF1692068.1 hypothetical protein [Zhongshania sp.]